MKRMTQALAGAALLLVVTAALLWILNTRDEPDVSASPVTSQTVQADSPLLQRGAYLARARSEERRVGKECW